jgi:hypothetical protein
MVRDCRMIDVSGLPIPFSCENRRFHTNLSKGVSHGHSAPTRGSVLGAALISHGGFSLWLEHVSEKGSAIELYWLMWYDDADGKPTIPLSGVFSKDELKTMMERLVEFTP